MTMLQGPKDLALPYWIESLKGWIFMDYLYCSIKQQVYTELELQLKMFHQIIIECGGIKMQGIVVGEHLVLLLWRDKKSSFN